MNKPAAIIDRAIFIFSFLFYTGSLNFFGGISAADNPTLKNAASESSTPILSLFQLIVYAATVWMVGSRFKQTLYVLTKRKFCLAFVLLVLLSFLWSAVPDATLRRAIVFLVITLLGLSFSVRYTLREQLFLLAGAMGIAILINVVFTIGFPWAAIESGEHQGAWRGVYSQKNVFARAMVLSGVTFLLAAIESRRRQFLFWGGLAISVLLILLSTSKGALVIFFVLAMLVQLFRAFRSKNSLVLPLIIVGVLVGGSAVLLLIENSETIVRILGRDLTLTGRTGIWSVVVSKIAQKPWLGYGYRGFWRGMEGESIDVWYETFFLAPNAHNGYLDLLVELGIIGFSCFALSFSKSCMRAIAWLRLNSGGAGLLPIMYLMFLILYNLAESTILEPALFVWLLYISITTTMLVQPIPIESAEAAQQSLSIPTMRSLSDV